jgi:glycosyltransferase involved in cell wall biosynthesis
VCSVLAAALTAHTALNAALMRRTRMDAPAVASTNDGGPLLSVLIPARNEAHRISPTINSVLQCDGIGSWELIVLDDHSTDGTASVVRDQALGDPRVRVISGEPLPNGWLGKPWACQQLGEAAAGSVLVFVDADVALKPAALRATIDLMNRHQLSLVSPYPRQIAVSAGERLVQPLLQWLWLTFLPLRVAERPKRESMSAANGQLLAIEAGVWKTIGGHTAVRRDVIEDVALARAVKRAGYRATVADGSNVVTCRMYDGWDDVKAGYSKSLWAALPSRAGSRAVALFLGLLYLLPPIAALVGVVTRRRSLAAAGGAGYLAGVVGRIVSAHATGADVRDAWKHPGSIAALLWMGRRSWQQHDSGQLEWKGRSVHVD